MSSPFFTMPKTVPGQLTMPIGSHHVCPVCRNSHVCDLEDCPLPCATECPTHGSSVPHSAQAQELQAKAALGEVERDLAKQESAAGLFSPLSDACTHCGQVFDAQRDIRVVNARLGCQWPEPPSCRYCWQVLPEVV